MSNNKSNNAPICLSIYLTIDVSELRTFLSHVSRYYNICVYWPVGTLNLCMFCILITDGRINELDEQSLTPLMWAAVYGQTDVVMFLVQAGANTEMYNDEGVTALMMACYHGSHGAVKALLDSALDIDQVDMVCI